MHSIEEKGWKNQLMKCKRKKPSTGALSQEEYIIIFEEKKIIIKFEKFQ